MQRHEAPTRSRTVYCIGAPAAVLRERARCQDPKAAANLKDSAAVRHARRGEDGVVEGGVAVLRDGVAAAV